MADFVEQLEKAMVGAGTDDDALVSILAATRTNEEMQELVALYTKTYGKDLATEIKKETSFCFETTLISLITDAALFDARLVNKAVKGLGTDDSLLNEVLCTRTKAQLDAAATAYQQEFKKDMLEDIQNDTSGDVKKLYTALCTSARTTPDTAHISVHAKQLYDAGTGKWGTNEDKFIEILGTHSGAYVQKLGLAYHQQFGKTLKWVIKDEFSGGIKNALLALVTPPGEFFSKVLRKAMDRLGTDDTTLIRVLVTQRHVPRRFEDISNAWFLPAAEKLEKAKKKAEEEAKNPKKEKKEKKTKLPKPEKPIKEWIKDETSGHYRAALIAIYDNYVILGDLNRLEKGVKKL